MLSMRVVLLVLTLPKGMIQHLSHTAEGHLLLRHVLIRNPNSIILQTCRILASGQTKSRRHQ
jgi:hypothetical protein